MTTPEQARDEMLAVFKAAWDPTGYTVLYSDLPGKPPGTEAAWARVTVRHSLGGQSSLTNAIGAQKWSHAGNIFVQLFVPMGQGGTVGYTLAKLVLDAYRAARGAVWYRNPRFREVGDDGAFSQFNCTIDFVYDDT